MVVLVLRPVWPSREKKNMDTSGIEPDTSRMLSERDKPTTPCALPIHIIFYIVDLIIYVTFRLLSDSDLT
jgi:hypothetical protein